MYTENVTFCSLQLLTVIQHGKRLLQPQPTVKNSPLGRALPYRKRSFRRASTYYSKCLPNQKKCSYRSDKKTCCPQNTSQFIPNFAPFNTLCLSFFPPFLSFLIFFFFSASLHYEINAFPGKIRTNTDLLINSSQKSESA